MNDQTVKHLELIQAVITRLAQNSFAYKGWSITLVSAIFVLAVKEVQPHYLLVALVPTVAFWGLDAYYLRQEQLHRKLYDAVRTLSPSEVEYNPFVIDTLPYSMHVSRFAVPYGNEVPTWWRTCWSKTIGWLYGPMILVVLLVTVLAFVLR